MGSKPGLHLIPIDYLVVGYTVYTSILLILSPPSAEQRASWVIFNAVAIGFVAALTRIDPDSRNRWLRILRRYYPAVLFTFYYEQSGSLVHVFFDGWFDAQIVAFENSILGFQPAVAVEEWFSPILNEIIIGCYVSYYVWLPAGLIYLLMRGRESEADKMILSASIAFFASYATFMLYPAEGPRYHLVELFSAQMEGWLFVPLVKQIMDTAAVHGGAMPSSHTAVALIVLIFVWRHSRFVRYLLAVIFIGLMLGCVWGRFHYISDVIVGDIIGVGAYLIAARLIPNGFSARAHSFNSG